MSRDVALSPPPPSPTELTIGEVFTVRKSYTHKSATWELAFVLLQPTYSFYRPF